MYFVNIINRELVGNCEWVHLMFKLVTSVDFYRSCLGSDRRGCVVGCVVLSGFSVG